MPSTVAPRIKAEKAKNGFWIEIHNHQTKMKTMAERSDPEGSLTLWWTVMAACMLVLSSNTTLVNTTAIPRQGKGIVRVLGPDGTKLRD